MAQNPPYKMCFVPKSRAEEEEDEKICKRYNEICAMLPASTEDSWTPKPIYQYQGFWYHSEVTGVGPMVFQDHFKARPSDVLVASVPKCGTTWLKSLTFAVMNRKSHPPSAVQDHPLNLFNSHDLVPIMETSLYNTRINGNRIPDLDILPAPRLLGTHMPYTSLPQSILLSGSRIVYICRNAKDNLVSWWHFVNKIRSSISLEPLTLEETFHKFCKGTTFYGPFWEHVVGYWKASIERPQNVLFLKYDDMMAEPALHLRRIAEFMGCPFSSMEEKEGVVDQIIELCSFETLSCMPVNVTGKVDTGIPFAALFRQGKVGDSANYLSPEMMEQLDRITKQKFDGLGLML